MFTSKVDNNPKFIDRHNSKNYINFFYILIGIREFCLSTRIKFFNEIILRMKVYKSG